MIYQLKLTEYNEAQQKNIWLDERHTSLNKDLTIGILGLGYLGKFIANKLKSLDYNIIGYKNTFIYFCICECENCKTRFNINKKFFDHAIKFNKPLPGRFCSV